MNTHSPRLIFRPRHTECRSHVHWDQDSLVLSVSLTYLDTDNQAQNLKLADRLDQDFGIEQGGYRLILGEMDMLLDSGKRIKSLEIRTNPLTWQLCSVRPIPSEPHAVLVDFVVDYDENGIASYKVPVRIIRDVSRRELSFSFENLAASYWALIADNLIIGATLDNYLSEIRLIDVNITFE